MAIYSQLEISTERRSPQQPFCYHWRAAALLTQDHAGDTCSVNREIQGGTILIARCVGRAAFYRGRPGGPGADGSANGEGSVVLNVAIG